MNDSAEQRENFAKLASHVASRRDSVLRAWRDSVLSDPQLPTAASLPRNQFNDHIPQILETFEQTLRSCGVAGSATRHSHDAAAHGLQRWQQGYDLAEVMTEWGRLQLVLTNELELFLEANPDAPTEVMAVARRALVQLCSDGISESTSKYFQLQQSEAAGHVRDLAQTLDELRQLERRRGMLWHQAAHDIRGNLGAVVSAAEVLGFGEILEENRSEVIRSLQSSVVSLRAMLDDVLSLARLQAGEETREVQPFDAAILIRKLCENAQPLARARGLTLRIEGQPSLFVSGDATKTMRIVQNLVLNAIKYTHKGEIAVTWGDSRQDDNGRWMVTIADTGPGFHAGPGAPIVEALEQATDEARDVDARAGEQTSRASTDTDAAHPADPRPVHQESGEGIGLSIVKRLCELLLASVEVESVAGRGTTFRIMLPRDYSSPGT